jgi:Cu/Ag efflux protein CusF
MKKAVALMVAAVFVLSVFGMALAGAMEMTGEITAIDPASMTMTVKEGMKETTMSYSDMTPVMEGDNEMSAADLKVGDRVTVTYGEEDGKNMAEKIMMEKGMMEKPMKY